jgi:hypothetical protein
MYQLGPYFHSQPCPRIAGIQSQYVWEGILNVRAFIWAIVDKNHMLCLEIERLLNSGNGIDFRAPTDLRAHKILRS